MNKPTRRNIRLVVSLVLLALLTLLVTIRNKRTHQEAVDDAVGSVLELNHQVIRHKFVGVAFLAFIALLVFMMWTALRANEGKDRAIHHQDNWPEETSAVGNPGSQTEN